MIYQHATIVITLAVATALRTVCQTLDRNETDGMFVSGLSPTGNLPATHFVSSGKLPLAFTQAINSPALLNTQAQAACVKANVTYPYSLTQITALLSGCSVSDGTRTVLLNNISTVVDESPIDFIARLGLQMIRTAF